MKILHTLVSYLVGYLAIAALPSSFPSFAFASPLEANIEYYDGYVNITQSGAGSDSALMMKRVPASGDIIEERWAAIIPPALLIAGIVAFIIISIVSIAGEDARRRKFTRDTVTKTYSEYPAWNWVICHSSYSVEFDGVEGTDYGYSHHELGISFDRSIGYDFYWAKSGTFHRHGDGGFLNWAYIGNVVGTDDGGATVHFGPT